MKSAGGLQLSRRGLLTGIVAVAGSWALPAVAEETPLEAFLRDRAVREWESKFDGTQVTAGELMSDQPLLSPSTAAQIERVLPIYQDIVARGGWRPIGGPKRMKIGTSNPAVVELRQRLAITGDLPNPQNGVQDVFDSFVDAAVRRFQIRHGLKPTGAVDQATRDIMNVPAELRLRQLETNLVRVRSMSGFLGDRYVFVNIPAAELEAVEGGRVVARHTAVVGKVDRQTPVLTSRVTDINFNPYWTVPVSIIRKDLIPKMKEDPSYFDRLKIRIFNGAQELHPSQINWDSDELTRLTVRQDPGEMNAMGSVKINFPNEHTVYMHDTPFKNMFGDNARFHSSGCMRIQNVRELVTWILRDTPNWGPEQVDYMFQNVQRVDAKVKNSPAVYTNYITAWATANGIVHFRDDVYGRDGIGELAAAQQL
ncbi:MAG: L,D-transpeptidase family protein [Hyphomicrobiaceae bacterium]|nr:L,D-transpeptidase family protein [Hyphomicrobiaceae bacterium]